MFLGQYQHTLDQKNRISIPKKFRLELKEPVVLTRGLDKCLFLYSSLEWEKLSRTLAQLPLTVSDARSFSRYLFSGATEAGFDSLGRVAIPDHLVKYASLEKEVLVIGVSSRIEIWAQEKWVIYQKKIIRKSQETAEKLSEFKI